nr:hypothetical protein [Tanacetum cinerariifolium]
MILNTLDHLGKFDDKRYKDVVSQAVKKDVSSLRYIALPNWFHKAHLESSNSDAQDACNTDVTESSGNSNPTATSKIPPADQMETLTVESEIPTVSSPVLTACLDNSSETSSASRLISKGVIIQEETPSLDNILTLSNIFKDILGDTTNTVDTNGVEADLSNMESHYLYYCHNIDFHQIVDFIEASHIRYALTINPTVYVSHIRQFWSTARIETTNEGTKILATVDGKPKTISESSIMRHLKLNDEEGISSLPDIELFENLALMGYNILPNQRFTFQKG